MLKDLLELKKQIDSMSKKLYIACNNASKEVITNKNHWDIYGPMFDMIKVENSLYVKIVSHQKHTHSEKIPIKEGFYMLFSANKSNFHTELSNKLKLTFENIEDEYIKDLLAVCKEYIQSIEKIEHVLSKSTNTSTKLETNLGQSSSFDKFQLNIKFQRPEIHLTRDNIKPAGAFISTAININLFADKFTDSLICERYLDSVEKYLIGKVNEDEENNNSKEKKQKNK